MGGIPLFEATSAVDPAAGPVRLYVAVRLADPLAAAGGRGPTLARQQRGLRLDAQRHRRRCRLRIAVGRFVSVDSAVALVSHCRSRLGFLIALGSGPGTLTALGRSVLCI